MALGETHKRPPCDSMIAWQIDKPIPMPSVLVVKNEVKIWSITFGSMPLPEIFNSDSHPAATFEFRLDQHPTVGDQFHRLDGIGYEIEENLLQLHPIACHRNKRFIQFSVHDNTVPLERALHQSEHLIDELI
ncbi:MAG: hypothetical protein WA693_15590, partial [Pseudolabrys sp.]